jgi:hypothetical protein
MDSGIPQFEPQIYIELGSFLLAQKEREGFKIIDPKKRELFSLFLGFQVLYNLLS